MQTPIYGLLAAQPTDVYTYLREQPKLQALFGTVTRTSDGYVFPAFDYFPVRSNLTFSAVSGADAVVSAKVDSEDVSFENGLHYRYAKIHVHVALRDGVTAEKVVNEIKRAGYTNAMSHVSNLAEFESHAGGTGDYSGADSYIDIHFRAGAGRRVPAPSLPPGIIPELGAGGGLIDLDNAAGYFFQNSHYFSGGLSHAGNPDVVEEVDPDVATPLIFSDATAGESGTYLQIEHQDHDHQGDSGLDHFYDRSTGVITLHHAKPSEFVLVRLAIDLEPDSDNSSADIILRCQTNPDYGYSFDIEEQLVSLDQGADTDYAAVASIPIFIGETLAETSGPATITPLVRFKNTTGDIKPRSLAFFIWS